MLSVSNLLCRSESGNERLRYGHVGAGADSIPRPVVVWAVTKACNLRCVHCYASAGADPAPGELTKEEGFRLLDDLKAFNVPAVLFSGGEPLVRPEILDFLRYACGLNLACTLSTNGVLIDDQMADNLAESGLKYVGISVDGLREKHDKLRGAQGAFAKTMAAIDRCRARGIRVGIRFTVHALNHVYLDDIFDLCLEHDIQRLCVYHLAYAGRGDSMQKVDLAHDETRSVVDRIFDRTERCKAEGRALEVLTVDNHADAAYLLLRLARTDPARAAEVEALLTRTGGNRSGCNIASVDPVGNVHYDQFSWHYSVGNVRKQPFSKIWSDASDPRLAILRDRRSHLPQNCRECRFIGVCNGNLRTRSEAAAGDWLASDPSCYISASERAGVPG